MSKFLGKSCVQNVPTRWARSGSIVHRAYTKLWINPRRIKLSPHVSTARAAYCTQIVHRVARAITRLKRQLSSQSTAITITTTIYI